MGKNNSGRHTQGVNRGSTGGYSNTRRLESHMLAGRIADALNPDKVPPKPSPVKVFTEAERKALEAKMKGGK